jgi:hypothetical protein
VTLRKRLMVRANFFRPMKIDIALAIVRLTSDSTILNGRAQIAIRS